MFGQELLKNQYLYAYHLRHRRHHMQFRLKHHQQQRDIQLALLQ
jgi:hypothetical protein